MPDYHEFRLWGREGGLKGGKLSWEKLTPEQRSARARHAAKAKRGERRPQWIRDSQKAQRFEDAEAYVAGLPHEQWCQINRSRVQRESAEKSCAKKQIPQTDVDEIAPEEFASNLWCKSRWDRHAPTQSQTSREPDPAQPAIRRRFSQPSISTSAR